VLADGRPQLRNVNRSSKQTAPQRTPMAVHVVRVIMEMRCVAFWRVRMFVHPLKTGHALWRLPPVMYAHMGTITKSMHTVGGESMKSIIVSLSTQWTRCNGGALGGHVCCVLPRASYISSVWGIEMHLGAGFIMLLLYEKGTRFTQFIYKCDIRTAKWNICSVWRDSNNITIRLFEDDTMGDGM
jgi:hypothetical protein